MKMRCPILSAACTKGLIHSVVWYFSRPFFNDLEAIRIGRNYGCATTCHNVYRMDVSLKDPNVSYDFNRVNCIMCLTGLTTPEWRPYAKPQRQ
jgi:hypothetical protein